MRRAAIFAILTLLLLAVAGVTAAHEGVLGGGKQTGQATEGTVPETTKPKKSSEQPAGKNRSLKKDNGNDGTAKSEGSPAGKTTEEPKPKEERINTAGEPSAEGVGKGKAEGKGKAKGKPEGKSKANGKAGAKEKGKGQGEAEDETGVGWGRQKVTLCHKGKNTITVGAPAKEAHLRHGDTEGAC